MTVNYKQFAAEDVIIHEVPQRFVAEASRQLDLSGASEKLTGPLKPFFDRKLKGSLSRHGFDVSRDPDSNSPLPDLIGEIVLDPSRLVAASQEMATHLHSVQTGVNPAGLLCVAVGTCAGKPAVSVLKLERDEGARVERKGSGKSRTLTMAYLDDLMISGNTRIFKSSVFALTGTTTKSLAGRVADDQRGAEHGHDVSSFFLSFFLGCKLKVEPRIATREVFAATERYIDEAVSQPERKAHYTLALQVEMQAPAPDFTPKDFAATHFAKEDRTPYQEFLAEREIPVAQAIPKDLSLIENRITKVKMETESGVMLLAPGALLDERVDVEEERVVIRDRVIRARGG